MKKLNELLDCKYDVLIKGIKINSKEIEPGDLFVCTKGVKVDRHEFIDDAINRGAAAIIVSKEVECNIPYVKVSNTNEILPIICSKFYDNPANKLDLIGITGTDGKTTTTTIIQTLIGDDKCGYIGTNGRSCHAFNKDTDNTTPDSDKLYEYFYEFVENKCKYVAMETSSEGFFRKRLENLKFKVGAITNITPEHLNIHKTFDNYIDCKSELFRKIDKDGYAILNKDDDNYEKVKESCNCNILTYGKDSSNDLQIKKIIINTNKTIIIFNYKNKDYEVISPLLGEFNVYNLACALLCCLSIDFEMNYLLSKVHLLKISGRLELLPSLGQNFSIMIDYAHTPNGISNLLNFVHTLNINRSIVVLGSAGERDYLKRPVMGTTVVSNASYVIFTYEDPRSEEVIDIINMMTSDIKNKYNNYEIVLDRSNAIKKAIDMADKNDMVLILGKGNETYEKLKDGTIYFNDFEEAEKHLKNRLEKESINV